MDGNTGMALEIERRRNCRYRQCCSKCEWYIPTVPDISQVSDIRNPQSNSIRARILTASLNWKKRTFREEGQNAKGVPAANDLQYTIVHEYIQKYFIDELFETGAQHTNQYYLQMHGNALVPQVTATELKKFFGIQSCASPKINDLIALKGIYIQYCTLLFQPTKPFAPTILFLLCTLCNWPN